MTWTHRQCNSEHCGCKTAHSMTWDDKGTPSWRCENCGKISPRRKRNPRKASNGMTKAQVETIAEVTRRILAKNERTAKAVEVKESKVEVRDHFVALTLEVGMVGDEGTMASIYCRDRRVLVIGPRGGLTLLNAKDKSKNTGWFEAVHGLTY